MILSHFSATKNAEAVMPRQPALDAGRHRLRSGRRVLRPAAVRHVDTSLRQSPCVAAPLPQWLGTRHCCGRAVVPGGHGICVLRPVPAVGRHKPCDAHFTKGKTTIISPYNSQSRLIFYKKVPICLIPPFVSILATDLMKS